MKKNLLFKLLLIAIPVAGMILLNSFSGGSPPGHTGSPGDAGVSCAVCHNMPNDYNTQAAITTNIPAEGYVLGQTYEITIDATSTTFDYGFQITAENEMDNKVGTWAVIDPETQIVGGGTHVTHTFPSVSGSWTMQWTAPNVDEGVITFYAAVNAINFNGATSGDQIVTTSTAHNALSAESIIFADLKLYPNPAVEHLSLDLPSTIAKADVTVYNYLGQQMLKTTVAKENKMLDVSHFQDGVYLLAINADGKRTTKSFIKK